MPLSRALTGSVFTTASVLRLGKLTNPCGWVSFSNTASPTRDRPTAAMDAAPTSRQTTDRVLMITSSAFCFNAQTAMDNKFQKRSEGLSAAEIIQRATREFDGLVQALTSRGIQVTAEEDTLLKSGDAVFPNNWISFHEGTIVLYPMMAESRRAERRKDIVERWKERLGARVLDYTSFELEGKFLEGTGSLVLDRANRIAYACKSQRTHVNLVEKFCQDLGYSPELFDAVMANGNPIYHTNVMMSVGDSFVIVCLESIGDSDEKSQVVARLEATNKEIINISLNQVDEFAGNTLQLRNDRGENFLVMSTRALKSFSDHQLAVINKHCNGGVIHAPLDTIEMIGGGGARCMLAEVFPCLH